MISMDVIKKRELHDMLRNFEECCDCSNTVMHGCHMISEYKLELLERAIIRLMDT